MTYASNAVPDDAIIPYQELLGNYDKPLFVVFQKDIIPYQELLGNYDIPARWLFTYHTKSY